MVSATPKNRTLADFVKVQSGRSMNSAFYEYCREEDIPASLSGMFFSRVRLRLSLVRKLGWRGLVQFRQHWALGKDLLRGVVLVPLHGTKLRQSGLVRRAFRSHRIETMTKEFRSTDGTASKLVH